MDLSFRAPQLPAEIWRMIFSNFDSTYQDMVQLWLNYRYVSKLFKEEAEHVFASKFVPKTSLFISNAISPHRASTPTERLSVSWWEGLTYSGSFTFEQFSENGDQAVFRYSCSPDHHTSAMFEVLKDQQLLRNVMKTPYHEVRMHQRVKDMRLPDLVVSDREHTLALDWRQLFSRFFAEEKKDPVVKPDQVSARSN